MKKGVAVGGLLALLTAAAMGQPSPSPPADLIALERQVSLKIAHVRIEGPSNSADLKRLLEAQRVDLEGEKALAGGDYKRAQENFLRANAIIGEVSQ